VDQGVARKAKQKPEGEMEGTNGSSVGSALSVSGEALPSDWESMGGPTVAIGIQRSSVPFALAPQNIRSKVM
jgi:hypothetical protein